MRPKQSGIAEHPKQKSKDLLGGCSDTLEGHLMTVYFPKRTQNFVRLVGNQIDSFMHNTCTI